jgi:ABC-type transporter Mla subunit MlaD
MSSWLPDTRAWLALGATVVDQFSRVPGAVLDTGDAVARLPRQLTELIAALERTTTVLDRALPELTRALAAVEARVDHVDRLASDLAADVMRTATHLERVLPEVSGAVGAMDGRLKNLDATISDLGRLVFGLIDAIPGARRVLRRGDPPPS